MRYLSGTPDRFEALAFGQKIKDRVFASRFVGFSAMHSLRYEAESLAENEDGLLRQAEVYWEFEGDRAKSGVIFNSAQDAIDYDDAMDLVNVAAKVELEREGETKLEKVRSRLQTMQKNEIYFLGNEVELGISVSGARGKREVVVNKWSGVKLLQDNGISVGYINYPNKTTVSYNKIPLNYDGVLYEPIVREMGINGGLTRADLVDAARILADFELIKRPLHAYRDAPLSNSDIMLGFYRPDTELKIVEQGWGVNKI